MNVYDTVIADIKAALTEVSAEDYRKLWDAPLSTFKAQNFLSGRAYNGVNVILLWAHRIKHGHKTALYIPSGRIFTKKKDDENAGRFSVRKGAKSVKVVYWKFPTETEVKKYEDAQARGDDSVKKPRVLCLYHRVFNVDDVVLHREEDKQKLADMLAESDKAQERIDADTTYNEILTLVNQWANPVTVNVAPSDKAFYAPAVDTVTVPEPGQFRDAQDAKLVLLHELAHATGHSTRLDRKAEGGFGSVGYALEELTAQAAALMAGDKLGLELRSYQVAYIKSWMAAFDADARSQALVNAMQRAQKAADYLLSA